MEIRGVYMSDCHECIMEDRIRQLEQKAEHNREEHSKFYDNFREFGLSHQRNTLNIQEMGTDIKEIKNDLKQIKEAPSRSADKFKSAVISAIGSAVGVAIIGIIAFVIVNGTP